MKFLGYDEIDQRDAYVLSMMAFGWPLTPIRLEKRVKYDDRWFDDSLLYAAVKGKAISQIAGLRIPTRTADGEETILGVAGVATLPSYARKGYSIKLFQELHKRFREEGMGVAFLCTAKSLVAYDLYRKFDYKDCMFFPRAVRPLVRRKKPKGIIFRRYWKKDAPDIDAVYGRFTRGLFGFVLRQKDYIGARMKIWKGLKDRLSVVETDKGTCGYVMKREMEGDVVLDEFVVPSVRNADRVLRNLESQEKGDYILAHSFAGKKQTDHFKSRGYKLTPESWDVCMVAPLSKSLSHRELSRLYQFKEGNFCMMGLDTF
ncbi:MAG: GNAT family N-acetyltransferase [Thermoplasmata archaeon]